MHHGAFDEYIYLAFGRFASFGLIAMANPDTLALLGHVQHDLRSM